jgi:hypothetical protein
VTKLQAHVTRTASYQASGPSNGYASSTEDTFYSSRVINTQRVLQYARLATLLQPPRHAHAHGHKVSNPATAAKSCMPSRQSCCSCHVVHIHMHAKLATLPHPPYCTCQVSNPTASHTSTCTQSRQPHCSHHVAPTKSANPPQLPCHACPCTCESATPPQLLHCAHQVSKPTIASHVVHVYMHAKSSTPTHMQCRQPCHSCCIVHICTHVKLATLPQLPCHACPHTCKVGNPATAAALCTPTPMQSRQAPSCCSL